MTGDPQFVIPHIVASAPKVRDCRMDRRHPDVSRSSASGTPEQRDLMGTRLAELTYDAPRRLEMMHGDAHPGNFMLLPDGRMGVIDFGAVAPLPGGLPVELGQMMRFALANDYEHLLTDDGEDRVHPEGRAGVGPRDRRHAAPVRRAAANSTHFHYTRKWLQKMTAVHMDRSVAQIKTARQMDIPVKLAIPMRVIASIVAISCQLDAHVPVRAIAPELVPGFADAAA